MDGINVLSLFDGMSCGQVALERAGIKVKNYFASEIDKYAMQITQKNYPRTIQLGDVVGLKNPSIFDIDLLLGGSPCQGFSFAGKQLAFDDPRSKLFFEYVRILKKLREKNPDIKFLLENVRMKKEYRDIISKYLGVEPFIINSSLVSAQNRVRYYWTNIEGVEQPEDKGIFLRDIILNDVIPIELDGLRGKRGCFGEGFARVYTDKSTTLRTQSGGGNIPSFIKSNLVFQFPHGCSKGGVRDLPKTATLTQQWHNNFFKLIHSEKALQYMNKKVKGGRSHWDFKHHSDVRNEKSAAVVANFFKGVPYNVLKDWDCMRKFYPIECERLQTLPDNYTEGVSNTQRYKMIGNGWTIDIISHILKGLKL